MTSSYGNSYIVKKGDTFKNRKIDTVDYWVEEIKAGIRYRTVFGRSKSWERYKNQYRGFWQKGIVPVNITYALGRSLVPQLYFRNPRIGIVAKKPGFRMQARVLERIDNHLMAETGLKYQMKSLALDTYLMGRGIGIVGYDSEYGYDPSFNDGIGDLTLTGFDKKGNKIEYNDQIQPGYPWFQRVSPSDFIVPWGTYKWEDAPWFAFRKMRKLVDIQGDVKYPAKKKRGLKAMYVSALENSQEGSTASQLKTLENDSQAEWVELWEIHDKRTSTVKVVTMDHPMFLRNDPDYLQLDGLPAIPIGFNEDPDYFWWAPDARLIDVQQQELNDIRTMAKKHRRVALLKILIDKDLIKKDEVEKMTDGDVKAIIRVDVGSTGDVRKAVTQFQSHVPPDFHIAAQEVREDVREIIGFSRNQMGAFEQAGGRRTAHEAEIVRQAAMIRIDERRDIMTDLLERVIRKENQLIFENWSKERIVDIVGDDGKRYWIRFTGPEIRSEVTYKINPEETLPSDQRTKREEAKGMIEMALKIPGMNTKYLMQVYASGFDWIDPLELFPKEGKGRNPEQAIPFKQFAEQQQNLGDQQ